MGSRVGGGCRALGRHISPSAGAGKGRSDPGKPPPKHSYLLLPPQELSKGLCDDQGNSDQLKSSISGGKYPGSHRQPDGKEDFRVFIFSLNQFPEA